MKENKSKPVIKVNNSGYSVTYTEDVFKRNLEKIASVFKSSQASQSLEKETQNRNPKASTSSGQ